MKLRVIALALSAALIATAPGVASAAGRGGHHHGPRVSIGIGVGFGAGGFYDPFFDPYWGYGYPAYPAYGYAPQPSEPCTEAQLNKVPTDKVDSPDYTYDRIDLARCKAHAAAAAQVSAPQASPQAPPPASYYFCRSTNAYYPQVGQCAEGWQQVAPKPPGT